MWTIRGLAVFDFGFLHVRLVGFVQPEPRLTALKGYLGFARLAEQTDRPSPGVRSSGQRGEEAQVNSPGNSSSFQAKHKSISAAVLQRATPTQRASTCPLSYHQHFMMM